jgi:hypothetical protein
MMRTIYAEGSDWSEAGTSQAPSQAAVDCSVEVQVVVQQQPAKVSCPSSQANLFDEKQLACKIIPAV